MPDQADRPTTATEPPRKPIRHAATLVMTLAELHDRLGLPQSVELRGIYGRVFEVLEVLVFHDALPEKHEAAFAVSCTLDEILQAVTAAESGGDQ